MLYSGMSVLHKNQYIKTTKERLMNKADRRIEKYKCQHSQLNPFKNRKRYDFAEMIEHSENQNRFVNKIVNKKLK